MNVLEIHINLVYINRLRAVTHLDYILIISLGSFISKFFIVFRQFFSILYLFGIWFEYDYSISSLYTLYSFNISATFFYFFVGFFLSRLFVALRDALLSVISIILSMVLDIICISVEQQLLELFYYVNFSSHLILILWIIR